MNRTEAIIIDWRYPTDTVEESQGPFSLIEVKLLRKRGAREEQRLKTPRLLMAHNELSTLEHQIADMNFVPIIRGPDGLYAPKHNNQSLRLVGCLSLMVMGLVIFIISWIAVKG